jgi:hypothetical protein
MKDYSLIARPSAMPSAGPRKPRYVLGTFWLIFGVLVLIGGFTSNAWGVLLGIGLIAYAIYLYRGGRHGFIFF